MPDALQTQVLIAGAGPIGLAAAIELTRRGVDCRIVDPHFEPPLYAKAVGVQPRTLEVFESMGVLRQILNAAIVMHGQLIYVNGEKSAQLDLTLPPTYRSVSSRFRSTRPSGFCARSSPCAASTLNGDCGSPDSSRTPRA